MKTIAVMMLLVVSAPAVAQPDMMWTAMLTWSKGQEAYDAGDFEFALNEFTITYSTFPAPELLWDLALTHYRLDNVYTARWYLRQYAKTFHAKNNPAKAERLGALLAKTIEEDYDALGLTAACDQKSGLCAIARWSEDVKRAWAAIK